MKNFPVLNADLLEGQLKIEFARFESFEIYMRRVLFFNRSAILNLRKLRQEINYEFVDKFKNECVAEELIDLVFDFSQFGAEVLKGGHPCLPDMEDSPVGRKRYIVKIVKIINLFDGRIKEVGAGLKDFTAYSWSDLSWENNLDEVFYYCRNYIELNKSFEERDVDGVLTFVTSQFLFPARIPRAHVACCDDDLTSKYPPKLIGLLAELNAMFVADSIEVGKYLSGNVNANLRKFDYDKQLKKIFTLFKKTRVDKIQYFLCGLMCWDECKNGERSISEAVQLVVDRLVVINVPIINTYHDRITKHYYKVNKIIKEG